MVHSQRSEADKFVFNVAGETFNFLCAKDRVYILLALTAFVIPKSVTLVCFAKRAGGTLGRHFSSVGNVPVLPLSLCYVSREGACDFDLKVHVTLFPPKTYENFQTS